MSLSKSIMAIQRFDVLTSEGNGGRFSAEIYPSQSARCTAHIMFDVDSAISSARLGSRPTVIRATLGIPALVGVSATFHFLYASCKLSLTNDALRSLRSL